MGGGLALLGETKAIAAAAYDDDLVNRTEVKKNNVIKDGVGCRVNGMKKKRQKLACCCSWYFKV